MVFTPKLPACAEAERIVVSGLLHGYGVETVDAEALSSEPLRAIARLAARHIREQGAPDQPAIVDALLHVLGMPDADEFLAALLRLSPAPGLIGEAAMVVRDAWMRRRLLALADEVSTQLIDLRLCAEGMGSRESAIWQVRRAVDAFTRAANAAASIETATPTTLAAADMATGVYGTSMTTTLAGHELNMLAAFNRDMAALKPSESAAHLWTIRRGDLLLARAEMFSKLAIDAGAAA